MKWSVTVERISQNTYRTMFTVGVQGFMLAYVEDDPEAKLHCRFIKQMFEKALSNLGVKHVWKSLKNPKSRGALGKACGKTSSLSARSAKSRPKKPRVRAKATRAR